MKGMQKYVGFEQFFTDGWQQMKMGVEALNVFPVRDD